MQFFIILIILTLLLILGEVNCQTEFTLQAGDLGEIRGKTVLTLKGRSYGQFLGIPYAVSQSKELRFQSSTLREGLLSGSNGPAFDATRYGSACPQPSGNGTEDCLYLNLFTPQVSNVTIPNLLPVIVFIHGAAFVSGSANALTGARLLNRDVLLVTFNYRLGVFGFFSLESELAPGNAALYDALTVLQWVKKYIHHFGGDANRVTLAGQSSGSASVAQIMLSPLVKGYFHRAIAASGSALDAWALAKEPLQAGLKVATFSGCFNPFQALNKTVVALCMKNLNQSTITSAQNLYQYTDRKLGGLGFGSVSPSLQVNLPNPFLSSQPINVLESGEQINVPLMIGTTRDDGGFAVRLVIEGFLNPNNFTDNSSFIKTELIPTILKGMGMVENREMIAESFSSQYLGAERQSGNLTNIIPGLIDLMGVLFFKSASYHTAKLHSRLNENTYFYSFEYEGQYTQHPEGNFPGGVAHADDLIYIFQLTDELNEKELLLSDMMVNYWANFATTGNPNQFPPGTSDIVVNWPKFNETIAEYLLIDRNIRSNMNYPDTWTISNKKTTCSNSIANNIRDKYFPVVLSAMVYFLYSFMF